MSPSSTSSRRDQCSYSAVANDVVTEYTSVKRSSPLSILSHYIVRHGDNRKSPGTRRRIASPTTHNVFDRLPRPLSRPLYDIDRYLPVSANHFSHSHVRTSCIFPFSVHYRFAHRSEIVLAHEMSKTLNRRRKRTASHRTVPTYSIAKCQNSKRRKHRCP